MSDAPSSPILAAARRARRPARIASAIAVVSGLVNLLSAMLPADTDRLRNVNEFIPGQVSSNAAVLVAAAGIAMLLLADGLHRRSRTAWWMLLVLLLVSAAGHVVKGLDIEEALFETFLAGYLVGTGEHFTARPDRRHSWRSRVAEIAGVVIAAYIFGVVGLLAATDVTFAHALASAVNLMVGVGTGIRLPEDFGDVLRPSVPALLLLGVLVTMYRALAPARGETGPRATADEALASNDSLAWFATREDKIVFRRNGGGVAYGLFGSVALASGDPLGPEASWDSAIDGFTELVECQGRYPAILGCGSKAARAYREHGFRQLYMGDEAVLHLADFTLQGGAMKTVRGSHTRALKAGYRASAMRVRDVPPELRSELRALSKAWRDGEDERGFSMALGRLFDEEDGEAVVVIGYDADGTARGFLHFVPWTETGASLDIMRRDRAAIAVLNDFLVAESARLLPELGIDRISLNFSALRGLLVAGTESNAPWNLRLQRRILLRLSNSFQIETLYRFNKKFSPVWVPRYLMVGALEDAPVVLFNALRAEGLLPSIRPRWRRSPKEASEE